MNINGMDLEQYNRVFILLKQFQIISMFSCCNSHRMPDSVTVLQQYTQLHHNHHAKINHSTNIINSKCLTV